MENQRMVKMPVECINSDLCLNCDKLEIEVEHNTLLTFGFESMSVNYLYCKNKNSCQKLYDYIEKALENDNGEKQE